VNVPWLGAGYIYLLHMVQTLDQCPTELNREAALSVIVCNRTQIQVFVERISILADGILLVARSGYGGSR
jgi:hypothetical protein